MHLIRKGIFWLPEHKKKERKTGIQPNRLHTLIQQEDFVLNDSGHYEYEYIDTIWGNKARIYALYKGDPADIKKALAVYAGQLNTHIKWIQDHKEVFYNAIIEDDMVELARDWLEGCDLVQKDGQTYYELEGGEQLLCPLTQEDFLNSLYIGGMDARCDDNDPEEMLFDIFINTAPDLFAYHSIEVFVKVTAEEEGWNYEISVNGLAG